MEFRHIALLEKKPRVALPGLASTMKLPDHKGPAFANRSRAFATADTL
jgi:hypothetical protein